MFDLYQGDCLTKMSSMSNESVDLIVTDPPYLMDFQSGFRKEKFKKIEGDLEGHDLIKKYFEECNRILKNDTHIYSFCSWHHIDFFKQEFEKYFALKNILVWNKGGGGIGDLDGSFLPNHELILFGHKGRRKLRGKRIPDVISVDKVKNRTQTHPTEKPVILIEKLIEASSEPGETVFEGFAGTGSHGVAALRKGRNFIGCEIEPEYVNIAKQKFDITNPISDLGGFFG